MLSNYTINQLKNKKIAVLGLGREGQATLNFLKKNKIKAEVLDAKFDRNYINKLKNYDFIFRTPGFPRLHPKLLAAEKNGAIISSHIKLFFDLCPAKVIGVTGTKGKTTTTLLVYQILKSKYKNVFTAGNFGKPALDILPKLNKNSVVVLELSSFQLQDLHKSPHIAVITNITLDHLDPSGQFAAETHQTAQEYFDSKMNIIRPQKTGDFAIIHPSLKLKTKNIGQAKKIFPEARLLETKLKGGHNLENIALAVQVGKILKVPEKNILKAAKNFRGVEHRLEFVRKVNGISFYNDSAATNPEATLAALKSFEELIHLIIGGYDKGLDYKKLIKHISKSRNIKSIMLIGQLKNKLYKLLKKHNQRKNLLIKKVSTLKEAVLVPYEAARIHSVSLLRMGLTLLKSSGKEEIVLLSPAAASYDMFQNYAERGEKFKLLVKNLKKGGGDESYNRASS